MADKSTHQTSQEATNKTEPEETLDASLQPLKGSFPGSIPGHSWVGTEIQDYVIEELVARGGMGAVYRAHQKALNRDVAIKVILSGHMASDQEIRRFNTEAEAVAQLNHDGIVPVYARSEHEGYPFFVMAHMAKGSLAERIRDNILDSHMAACLVRDIARAIDFAHAKGFVHRDIKPSNILFDEHDKPRIADFGLARQVNSDSDLTRSGQILGTPEYMSPEQARGEGGKVDGRADVYSLGAVLYRSLVGRAPFHSPSSVDVLVQVLNDIPVPLRQLNPSVPVELNTICLKCLEKEPDQRYQTAGELADDLDRFLNGQPIRARQVGILTSAWRWYTGRKDAAIYAAGGYALIVGLIFLLWNIFGYCMVPLCAAYSDHIQEARTEILLSTCYLSLPFIAIGYLTLKKHRWVVWITTIVVALELAFALRIFLGLQPSHFMSRYDALSGLMVVVGVIGMALFMIASWSTRQSSRN